MSTIHSVVQESYLCTLFDLADIKVMGSFSVTSKSQCVVRKATPVLLFGPAHVEAMSSFFPLSGVFSFIPPTAIIPHLAYISAMIRLFSGFVCTSLILQLYLWPQPL